MRVIVKHPASARQLGGVATIAAPLLAAAAIATVGVVIPQPDSLAFPTLALAVLLIAAVCLVTSINASVWAAYSNVELPGSFSIVTDTPVMSDAEYAQATAVYKRYRFWSDVTRFTYDKGVFALWIGIGIALMPPHLSGIRMILLVPVAGALVLEYILVFVSPKCVEEPSCWAVSSP